MVTRVRLLILVVLVALLVSVVALPASANPAPSCAVTSTTVGKVLVASPIYWGPDNADIINYLGVKAGQSFIVLGTDASKSWVKIDMSCSSVWVPAAAIEVSVELSVVK